MTILPPLEEICAIVFAFESMFAQSNSIFFEGSIAQEVIEISDDDDAMESAASARSRSTMRLFAKNFVKNADLKGRKRFTADLKDMQELCKQNLVLYDFKIHSESLKIKDLRSGRKHSTSLLVQKFVLATKKDLSNLL